MHGGKHFQCDNAVKSGVDGTKNGPHTAPADAFLDEKMAQPQTRDAAGSAIGRVRVEFVRKERGKHFVLHDELRFDLRGGPGGRRAEIGRVTTVAGQGFQERVPRSGTPGV